MSEITNSPSEPARHTAWYYNRAVWGLIAAALAVVWLIASILWDPSRQVSSPAAGAADRAGSGKGLFENAATLLNNLEQFDSPEMQERIVGSFNKWLDRWPPSSDWRPDPLVETLREEHRRVAGMDELSETQLASHDGPYLREVVWLRNIALAARGEKIDDLERGKRLFDWVVRNIQLDPPRGERSPDDPWLPHQPWRTLLYGVGDADQRAWIFVLLARQQQLDAAMLALGDPDDPESLRPWLPALLIQGQLYLFDPALGLPIPGPEGQGVATLEQVAADESLLRRLDLDADHPYPVRSADVERVVAWVEATPQSLSRRMQLIEQNLAGDEKLSLWVDASATADRLTQCRHVAGARLWPLTFDHLLFYQRINAAQDERINAAVQRLMLPFHAQPALEKARTYHFKGNYIGAEEDPDESSANRFYQMCRFGEGQLNDRVTERTGAELQAMNLPREQQDAAARQLAPLLAQGLVMAKQHASYWLGLVAYERERYDTAIDFFQKRTLEEFPDGAWEHGARYNLARSLEAGGQVDQALALYEADDSPQRHGNLLRATWLREGNVEVVGP